VLVRGALVSHGQLGGESLLVAAGDVRREFRRGDIVLVTRNDYRHQIFNGTRATVTDVDPQRRELSLQTDDTRTLTVGVGWAADHGLEHAYAMTVHKAQGLTVDHAFLYGTGALTREAGYVGMSRGQRENHVYALPRDFARTADSDSRYIGPVEDGRVMAELVERLERSRTHSLASRDVSQRWVDIFEHHLREPDRSEGLAR
jgi:hypothetical protein